MTNSVKILSDLFSDTVISYTANIDKIKSELRAQPNGQGFIVHGEVVGMGSAPIPSSRLFIKTGETYEPKDNTEITNLASWKTQFTSRKEGMFDSVIEAELPYYAIKDYSGEIEILLYPIYNPHIRVGDVFTSAGFRCNGIYSHS